MPDESCRSCGGGLGAHIQCPGCRRTVQKICITCNALTRRQFHDQCEKHEPVPSLQNGYVLETVMRPAVSKRSYSLRSIAVCIAIAGIFILGFATAAYLDVFQDPSDNPKASASNNIHVIHTEFSSIGIPLVHTESALTPNNVLQNCLAYGSGESVTVTCPTEYGYVYKAILDMPKDLASKFSDSVFSIRGVSVIENSDATVVLHYQESNYLTSFFGN